MTSCAVVIPVYRATLHVNERLSLTQCVRQLGAHRLVLARPASLDVSAILAEFPGLGQESFPDEFFKGVRGYNALMLSAQFYERFRAFEFILIHQLDAFVFSGDLSRWCTSDVDYIGAPWLSNAALSSTASTAALRLKAWLYDRLNLRDRQWPSYPRAARLLFKVGNGGLSLRRVAAFAERIQRHGARIDALLREERPVQEDQFFSVSLQELGTPLRVPDWRTAARFAIELSPRRCVERVTGGQLPFGCHGWDKYDTAYWREQFAVAGYPLGSPLNPPQYFAGGRPELKPFLPLHRRVLEIGCGRGGFRTMLSPEAEVWGVEADPEAAAVAGTVLTRVLTGYYEQVRAQLPDSYFDLVVCNDVIEHMPDDLGFLRDIQSKMAPGAQLVGSIPNMRHWPVFKALVLRANWDYEDEGVMDRTHLRFYTVNSFPRLLRAAGFTVLKFEGINRNIRSTTRRLLMLLGPRRFADVAFLQFGFSARRA